MELGAGDRGIGGLDSETRAGGESVEVTLDILGHHHDDLLAIHRLGAGAGGLGRAAAVKNRIDLLEKVPSTTGVRIGRCQLEAARGDRRQDGQRIETHGLFDDLGREISG